MTTIHGNLSCHICKTPLAVRAAKGRTSNKPFVMFICPKDGRHFRAFVTDKAYVQDVLSRAEMKS